MKSESPSSAGSVEGDPGSSSHSLDPDVVVAALSVLEEGLLFRYDSPSPESSPASCFEREFAEFLGARYAIAVNSCSSALFLALIACGVRPGDEVLIPAFTFIAVPSAAVHAGARPVLVESTADLAIDCDDLERKISSRTKALLLSYMRGRVPDLERVLNVCRRSGIQVVEDVAHGMGVEWDGLPLGRFGRAAAFSFQSHKLIDGGEGGIVVTDERDVALRVLWQSGCYDRNWRRHFLEPGDDARLEAAANALPVYGMRMSNLTASVLRPQLKRLPTLITEYAARYRSVAAGLDSCPIRLPVHPDRVTPVPDSLQFEIPALTRLQLLDFVRRCHARDVDLEVLGLDPDNSRCFWNWRFVRSPDCPRTRDLLGRLADMALPLWLDERRLGRIAEVIRTSLDEAAAGPAT